ncbi:hypothetical protein BH09MYX1_BH09MYX1_55210 [soil metagenome]
MQSLHVKLSFFGLAVLSLGACAQAGHRGAKSAKGDVIGNDSLTAKNIPSLTAGGSGDDDDTPRPTPSTTGTASGKTPPATDTTDPRAKYAQFVAAITTTLPTWKTGAGAAVMLYNKDRNQSLPFLLDNREAAAIPRSDTMGGHYSFYLTSDDGGWFVMTIGSFKAGHLECRKDNINIAMGFKDDFAGDDPEVMWGDNDGEPGSENGSCKVDIYPGKTENDWTASASGILVANNKERLMRISNAFIQFRNMPVGAPTTTPTPPPAGTGKATHATGNQTSKPAATSTSTGRVRLPR